MQSVEKPTQQTLQKPSAHLGFLGLCCGVGVSTIYLCQPLLPEMGATFGANAAAAGQVGVATQVGYALGMLTVTPLGDTVERRSLIMRMFAMVSVALLLQAMAPSLALLILLSATSGFMACVTHLVLPIAPDLAEPAERGRAIGIVMTGLLTGVLLGRTFAGWVSEAASHFTSRIASWRFVFLAASLFSACLVPAIRRLMPLLPPKDSLTYPAAMRSLWELLRDEPALRESCLIGALCFGAFSAFWNTFAFVMQGHGLGAAVTGSFGLVAAAGAGVASFTGRLADRRGSRFVMSLGLSGLALAFLGILLTERVTTALQGAGRFHLWPYLLTLGAAVVLMDMSLQGVQIGNQSRIFALRPDARSRLNTVYMTTYFIGGSLASAMSPVLWQHFGVAGISVLETVLIAAAVLTHLAGARSLAAAHSV